MMTKSKITAVMVLCVFLFGMFTTGAIATKPEEKQGAKPEVKVEINLKGEKGEKGEKRQIKSEKFKDMAEAQWALKHVYKLTAEEIVAGYEDGTFKPNKPVTRAEAVVLTMKKYYPDQVAGTVYLPFKDSNAIPLWSQNAISLAATEGYIDAAPMDNFQPNKPATREWIAELIVKAGGYELKDVDLKFKDKGKISADSMKYVTTAVSNDIFAGFPDGSFKPNDPVTRAQIVTILNLTDNDYLPDLGTFGNKVVGIVTDVKTVTDDIYLAGTVTIDLNPEDDNAGETTYQVSKEALIYVNNVAVSLNDVSEGSTVRLVLNKKTGLVTYIEVIPDTVKGVISAVYSSDSKLSIIEKAEKEKNRNRNRDKVKGTQTEIERNQNSSAEPTTYIVASTAVITLNGAASALSDLKPGDSVKIVLNEDGEAIVVKAVRDIEDETDDDDDEDENEDEDEDENEDEDEDEANDEDDED